MDGYDFNILTISEKQTGQAAVWMRRRSPRARALCEQLPRSPNSRLPDRFQIWPLLDTFSSPDPVSGLQADLPFVGFSVPLPQIKTEPFDEAT